MDFSPFLPIADDFANLIGQTGQASQTPNQEDPCPSVSPIAMAVARKIQPIGERHKETWPLGAKLEGVACESSCQRSRGVGRYPPLRKANRPVPFLQCRFAPQHHRRKRTGIDPAPVSAVAYRGQGFFRSYQGTTLPADPRRHPRHADSQRLMVGTYCLGI